VGNERTSACKLCLALSKIDPLGDLLEAAAPNVGFKKRRENFSDAEKGKEK
jgi:hypothetical protein